MIKRCSTCKLKKIPALFHKNKNKPNGLSSSCKDCASQRSKAHHWANRERILARRRAKRDHYADYMRQWHLMHRYGVTIEERAAMSERQQDACDICGKHEIRFNNKSKQIQKLSVDHCHKTGRIRGLLCNGCNRALGCVLENKDTLRKMIVYLETHEE